MSEKCPDCGCDGPIASRKIIETLAAFGKGESEAVARERAAKGEPPAPHLPNGPACLTRQLAQEREKNKRLGAILDRAMRTLWYPQNGHHHCRWCDAGTHNEWGHDGDCGFVRQCKAVDAVKQDAAEYYAAEAAADSSAEGVEKSEGAQK